MINVAMILFQQLQNLLYATVMTSWQHLPQFLPLLGMALILVVFFLGVALFLGSKQKKYLLLAYYYVAISVFVILVDILARVGLAYVTAIFSIASLFVVMSLLGYLKQKSVFGTLFKTVSKQKLKLLSLLFVVVLSTFFFSKFIYDNGLHDEYQHHAVVEDMLQSGQWPIRDELRYGIDLSDYYHYGWYYLVILVKLVFPVSIEVALDLVKLLLFVPVIPLFYGLIEKYLHTKWYESLFLSVTLLVQGPALFFLDAYSGNVLFSQENEIIYEPLFFQLAGVTWFGIVVMVSLLAIAYSLLTQHKKVIMLFVYLVFSLWTLFLLNKAYLIVYIPTSVLLGVYAYRKQLHSFFENKKLVLSLAILGLVSTLALIVSIKFLSPLLFNLLKGESRIPFIRSLQRLGYPYSSRDGLVFQPILSLGSLRAFGLLPLVSMIILVKESLQKKLKSFLTFLLLVFLWAIPAVLNFSGSELALNKLYIPALWVSTLFVAHFALQQTKRLQYFTFTLVLSSVIAPLLYFTSISLPGSQVYWGKSDAIIEYLFEQDRFLVVSSDDGEYSKYLINNLDVQLVSVRTSNINVDEVVEYKVTVEKHPNEEPLAQTDTHYLYAK